MARRDDIVDFALAERGYRELTERAGGCKPEDWFEFMPFDGTHEFPKDDAAIDKLMLLLC